MYKEGKQSKNINPFNQSIARRILLVILPLTLTPILIGGILFLSLSNANPTEKITMIFGIMVLTAVFSLYFMTYFVQRQIVGPIQTITVYLKQYKDRGSGGFLSLQRNDEIRTLVDAIKELNKNYTKQIGKLDLELLKLTRQIQTSAEISRKAMVVENFNEYLQMIANLIQEQFEHDYVAILLKSSDSKHLTPRVIAGLTNPAHDPLNLHIPIDKSTIAGRSVVNQRISLSTDVRDEPVAQTIPFIEQKHSELAIPIELKDEIIGVLDIYDKEQESFSWDEITILQTTVDQVAVSIHNYWSIENSRLDPKTASYLFNASYKVSMATSQEVIFNTLETTLDRMRYSSAFYIMDAGSLRFYFSTNCGVTGNTVPQLTIDPDEILQSLTTKHPIDLSTRIEQDFQFPPKFKDFCLTLNFNHLYLYPFIVETELLGLLFFGAMDDSADNLPLINALTKLFDLTLKSLKNSALQNSLAKRLRDFQTLDAISHTISTETNLNQLYKIIHKEVLEVMGNVNFLIAIYSEMENTIEIPYMDDGEKISRVPPFPLGQGLTSIIIRTRQPLMIVEDTVNRSRALGAIITDDKPAQSWLGVPIISGDELLGAIVVQDLEQEKRFDEDDMSLLLSMASQISIAFRNTRLIEAAENRAERDRQLVKISNRIWNAVNLEDILSITAEEVSRMLDTRSTTIEVNLPPKNTTLNSDETTSAKEPVR